MSRFLHTADWQIGRQFSSLHPDNAQALAEARIAAVERLAALAASHQVDAVLVAGDVFDAQGVSDRVVRRLFNALAGFSGPWLMIPGNHDAALAESVWTRAERLRAVPEHAHLLLKPAITRFDALGFAVLAAPLTQRHTHTDLSEWFDTAETPPGLLRIGLAHGSVQGLLAEGIAATNPIAPDRARRARLDYLALGDWHGCKIVDERTAYSGTPEPDRFKDNGAGQALLVEMAGPGAVPRISALATARYRWQSQAADLQVASDLDGLLAWLQALGKADVVDLQLSGRMDLADKARLDSALGQAEARARHLQVDRSALQLRATEDDIAALRADGYLGDVLGELRQAGLADDAAGRTAQHALAILAEELGRAAVLAGGPGGGRA